ncbi:MAG: homoserine kinase [Phycisphaerales bacterium]|nr:homoserine kinase [Phycisphaerales bacterium]
MSAPVSRVCARAPGSIGNFGPGLDVLGCAIDGGFDEVTIEWRDTPGIEVADAGHRELPSDPERNTAAIAARAVFALVAARTGRVEARGVTLRVTKGLPLCGGLGGSAASAVAGAVAANAITGSTLTMTDLAACALEAEERVAGRHLDNIAPSLLGGIVLVRSLDPIDLVRVVVPVGLTIVLATPGQRLKTAEARAALPIDIPRAIAIHQMAQVGAIVAACASGDLALLGRSIDDRIAEPARGRLLPGFAQAKQAALDAGALGASISGAGPTAFALVDSHAVASRVSEAMSDAYARAGLECTARIASIDELGATVRSE